MEATVPVAMGGSWTRAAPGCCLRLCKFACVDRSRHLHGDTARKRTALCLLRLFSFWEVCNELGLLLLSGDVTWILLSEPFSSDPKHNQRAGPSQGEARERGAKRPEL